MSRLAGERRGRMLVIGLDGGTYDVFTPLAESGVMPNMALLMRRSALAVLRSTEPAVTPTAWTSFLTGCDPQRHGILDYRRWDPAAGRLVLNDSTQIACPTLIEAVSRAGGDVVSLNLPMTYPPPPDVRGIVVGGIECPSAAAALRPYREFARRLQAADVEYDVKLAWRHRPTSDDDIETGMSATEAAFRSRPAAARLADAMTDWRLMIVQFQSLDSLQHRCWHLLGVGGSDDGPPRWIARTQQTLRSLDDCLGELLELAAHRGAEVLVASDHGFGPFREKIHVCEILRRRGLLVPAVGLRRLAHSSARIGWKANRWFRKQIRPRESAAKIRRPRGMHLPVDWNKTTAVALHGSLGAMVYLNCPQRFPHGPLATPRQREQAAFDTVAALSEATHAETGEPLFSAVFDMAERFGVDPIARGWPDVAALPADGFHTRTKFHRAEGLTAGDADMTGTHRPEGVLMLDGPGAAAGERFSADLRDVAPTILDRLGLPQGDWMTGRPLREMYNPTPVDHSRPAARPAVDVRPLDANDRSTAAAATPPLSAKDEAVIEKRLRDLGYVD